jgi:hypothetical protein
MSKPQYFISVFHRKEDDISRLFFYSELEAVEYWINLLNLNKTWSQETLKSWSRKMKNKWKFTCIFTSGTLPPIEIYAIELWDRQLWSKDAPNL